MKIRLGIGKNVEKNEKKKTKKNEKTTKKNHEKKTKKTRGFLRFWIFQKLAKNRPFWWPPAGNHQKRKKNEKKRKKNEKNSRFLRVFDFSKIC